MFFLVIIPDCCIIFGRATMGAMTLGVSISLKKQNEVKGFYEKIKCILLTCICTVFDCCIRCPWSSVKFLVQSWGTSILASLLLINFTCWSRIKQASRRSLSVLKSSSTKEYIYCISNLIFDQLTFKFQLHFVCFPIEKERHCIFKQWFYKINYRIIAILKPSFRSFSTTGKSRRALTILSISSSLHGAICGVWVFELSE
jgi:hypothetical protein